MTGYNDWFGVDKAGLAQLAERRDGKAWVLYELISNAWDEASTEVTVQLVPEDGKPYVTIVVTDDNPTGFAHLAHAWTLFSSTSKRADAEKRGVFTMGEKLVLSLCTEAVIKTTTGAVLFDHRGRHLRNQWKTKTGSVFEGTLRMTRAELDVVRERAQLLIPPAAVTTTIDGDRIERRDPIATVDAVLPTVIADKDGQLRPTSRKTTLSIYAPRAGEVPMIYEMGVPVVETADALHVSVGQKVPLNMERDNVTPAYLATVRGLVLATAHDQLDDEEQRAPWVTAAMAHPVVPPAVVGKVLDSRFGIKRVAADLSDREAEDIAKSRGYTVVHGGSLPGAVWEKAKAAGLIKPAGQVTPSPKPFHEDGEPLRLASAELREQARPGLIAYQWLGRKLLGINVEVVLANDWGWEFRAAYRPGHLTLNLGKLGMPHFTDRRQLEEVFELAIHEYAHHYEKNHLAEGYHEACCELGARLAMVLVEFSCMDDQLWGELIGARS